MSFRYSSLLPFFLLACSNPSRDFGLAAGGGGGGEAGGAAGGPVGAGSANGGAAGVGSLGGSTASAGSASREEAGASGAGASNQEGGAAGASELEAGAAGALEAADPLQILSVTPVGTTATTRSSISVTFSRPVAADSVAAAAAVEDDRGPVAGKFVVAGAVATFQPRGSLCLAQHYRVSVATSATSLSGEHLDRAKSYAFSIPDGQWGRPETLRANITYPGQAAASIDQDGNAFLAWTEGADNTAALDYYDARVRAWNGAQTPPFLVSNGIPGAPLVALGNGHALAVYPSYGAAERHDSGLWTVTPSSDLLSSVGNFISPTLSMSNQGDALLSWNDGHGSIGASVFTPAKDPSKAGFWVAPSTPASAGWGVQSLVHALPDGSFLMVFSERPGPSQSATNLVARRYLPATGWASERKIAAGGPYFQTVQDNFGNLLLVNEGGTPIARYSYAADAWATVSDLPAGARCMLALAGDGVAFCVYFDESVSHGSRVLVQRLVEKTWSPAVELRNVPDSVSLSSVVADDCGNAQFMWSEGSPAVLYARRYTPAGGWAPALALADVAAPGQAASNGRGEVIMAFDGNGNADDAFNVEAIRFE